MLQSLLSWRQAYWRALKRPLASGPARRETTEGAHKPMRLRGRVAPNAPSCTPAPGLRRRRDVLRLSPPTESRDLSIALSPRSRLNESYIANQFSSDHMQRFASGRRRAAGPALEILAMTLLRRTRPRHFAGVHTVTDDLLPLCKDVEDVLEAGKRVGLPARVLSLIEQVRDDLQAHLAETRPRPH